MKCEYVGCDKQFGLTQWKFECAGCGRLFCCDHFVDKSKISYLSGERIEKARAAEGLCEACIEKDGYDGRLWKRSLFENMCAYIEADRTCPEKAKSTCLCCGHRFCAHHTREEKILDSDQRKSLTKFPGLSTICTTCAKLHVLDESNLISRAFSPTLKETDKLFTERIQQAKTALIEVRDGFVVKASDLADGAEKRANQYVLRLAIAGLNFLLIYLLVPNIQRWQALDAVVKAFTVGGIVIASVWIGKWVFDNLKEKATRNSTLLLLLSGTAVLFAKFYFGM